MTKPETFGQRVRRFMIAKGLNQSTLSEQSDIERTVLNRIISGKRHPKEFEIGMLAKCLDVTVEELMVGLELLPQIQRAVDKERDRTERVLRAEAIAHEAVARADRFEAELERERADRVRDALQQRLEHEAAIAAWSERLRGVEVAAALQKKKDNDEVEEVRVSLRKTLSHIAHATSTEEILRHEIAGLQRQLADERSKKAASQLLAGLAGAVIGRAMD